MNKYVKAAKGIHIKKSAPGLLHQDLGLPSGQPIPSSKLAGALQSSDPALKKRAVFAANAKQWKG